MMLDLHMIKKVIFLLITPEVIIVTLQFDLYMLVKKVLLVLLFLTMVLYGILETKLIQKRT